MHLVNKVVPAAELEEATLKIARKLARMPAPAIKFAKASLNQQQMIAGLKQLLRLQRRGHGGAAHLHQGPRVDGQAREHVAEGIPRLPRRAVQGPRLKPPPCPARLTATARSTGSSGPASVAIVGASERPGASSGFVVRNLLAQGYAGRIVPVHRTAPTIFGLPAVAAPRRHGCPPDAVLMGLRRTTSRRARRGRRPRRPGRRRAGERLRRDGRGGQGAAGPSPRDRAAAWHGRLRPELPRPFREPLGPCALQFAARSRSARAASRCSRIPARWASRSPIPGGSASACWSRPATPPSPTCRTTCAISRTIDATRVALLVIEKIDDPAAFADAVAAMHGAGKRVIVLRAGRSERGAVASAAHTGALAGSDAAFLAFFERIGAIVADDIATALETAALLSSRAASPRSRPGGAGGRAAWRQRRRHGACHRHRRRNRHRCLRPWRPATVQALRAILPAYATPQNPLDLTGIVFGQPAIYGAALAALADDPSDRRDLRRFRTCPAVSIKGRGRIRRDRGARSRRSPRRPRYPASCSRTCRAMHADFEHALDAADVPVSARARGLDCWR